VEWAAQWSLFGVTIEPCGKDLSTAGGSRERSDAIAREVFEREPPINVPYEFLNIGGRKMSTSKGRGAAAHEIVDVVPPEQIRFLFLRQRPNQVIEFDPEGTDAIPRLFDEFDRFADATAGKDVRGDLPPGFERIFRYSLLSPDADADAEAAAFRPAFGHLALLVQIPGIDLQTRIEAEKGSPLTPRELEILDARAKAARAWLETYAPESARILVRREAVPSEAGDLHADQRRFLARLADRVAAAAPNSGDDWQSLIFEVAHADDVPPRRAFEAIYLAFLGRPNGPRAGWLLASLDSGFVRERAWEASGWTAAGPPARLPVGG
jgi:lysyl-tRNA synthetase class 1